MTKCKVSLLALYLCCVLDFAKAFDRIDHNVLIGEPIDLEVRTSLIPWIISFLSNRRRVKLGEATTNTQTSLDTISVWASLNWMKLNAKKSKELRVCYLRETPQLAPLQIDDQALELVSSHNILGLVIQSNLK